MISVLRVPDALAAAILAVFCVEDNVFLSNFLVAGSMFKKPKRNFRARKVQDEDSDGDREEDQEEKMEIAGETYIVQETAAEEDPTPIAPAVKKKKKKKAEEEKPVKKSSSVLSFTEEGESNWISRCRM